MKSLILKFSLTSSIHEIVDCFKSQELILEREDINDVSALKDQSVVDKMSEQVVGNIVWTGVKEHGIYVELELHKQPTIVFLL